MADKKPKEKDGFVELIKKLWSPVAGILGAVTSLFNFYQLWSGNQATIIYILAGGGFLLLLIALAWVGFSKKDIPKRGNRKAIKSVPRYSLSYRRAAWSGLGLLTLLAIFSTNTLIQHRTEQENKLIVLITAFEGPEDVYGLRNEIIENLNSDFSSDENVEIISIDEIITISKGSEYARELGENYLADIVIWGWYRPTENPNINIHIENLSPNQLLTLQESENFQPVINLSELESFSFQQQTGDETSALISFLAGLIEYNSENYENALKYFNISLETLTTSPLLFENKFEVYFYRGISYANLGKFQNAIQDFNQAILIDPKNSNAYYNQGCFYAEVGDYQNAILNFDLAISINPQDFEAYNNRGNAYSQLGNYEQAIQDYSQAIFINPNDSEIYNNRGTAYAHLSYSELAIQDFNTAIELNPEDFVAYNNRGNMYLNLSDYESAIRDYGKSIIINPKYTLAYQNRGVTYLAMDDYQNAIIEFNIVIKINPQYAKAYYGRGLAYKALGKTTEAEADFAKYKELTGQDAP